MTTNQKNLLMQLKKIKAVAMDVDGCLFPDNEIILPDDRLAKSRSRVDGQGISLMRAIGLKIALITGEGQNSQSYRIIKSLVDKWNNLPSSQSQIGNSGWSPIKLFADNGDKSWNKGEVLSAWLAQENISFNECAVMGDDLIDLSMIKLAGFKVCPITAEEVIKKSVDYVTTRAGGYGAVRDLANLLIEARNVDPEALSLK